MLENFNKKEKNTQIDSLTEDIIENTVIDWINKYPLEEGNLAIENPNDPNQIKLWVGGVWGRIAHQLADSGLPYDNKEILSLAQKYFHNQLSKHKFYPKIKPYLPK